MGFLVDLLGGWIGPVVIGAIALFGTFMFGSNMQKGKQAKRELKATKELIEDVQEHAARRADDSGNAKQRLRDQSSRDG